ncbi:hypothetical protein DM02DRAFT_90945 [Periconia macrospinosa]|uniref:Uncharacterized protein n=1 Tax=Periconia macrospinosa TaxID=97972 RepID=A0A2V1DG79_9PLEO|nr:hypothetical protein DM02DRAFT_90945 [Periconia macrospinosa]
MTTNRPLPQQTSSFFLSFSILFPFSLMSCDHVLRAFYYTFFPCDHGVLEFLWIREAEYERRHGDFMCFGEEKNVYVEIDLLRRLYLHIHRYIYHPICKLFKNGTSVSKRHARIIKYSSYFIPLFLNSLHWNFSLFFPLSTFLETLPLSPTPK